jgi:hypothetical protein
MLLEEALREERVAKSTLRGNAMLETFSESLKLFILGFKISVLLDLRSNCIRQPFVRFLCLFELFQLLFR